MERKLELLVDTNTSPSEEASEELEQLELEATTKDGGELVDESSNAKDGEDSSPLKDPSTDQVNEVPQNESTTVKDPSQNEPNTEKNPDSPAQNEPLIPYKPQAIKFNELLDQGKELKFAQTLQEVAPSCCRSIINSTSTTKTESVELPVPDSNLPQTTEKSGTPSIDTPPNSPMPELEAQDDALPCIEPVKEEEEEENNSSSATVIEHNPDEDAIQSEPRRTSSPSFYISSFEQDIEIPGEETHGNIVPNMGLDNNDVYLNNNNDENNVPASNMPRSTGFRLGSSAQFQANNNPSSYTMTAPPGFGTRDEGPPSLNPIVDQNFTQPEPAFIHTNTNNRNPQQTIDLNRCFPLGGTYHNFMQNEPMMPPRPPGHHHHQFMQLINQAAGSAGRTHWHMGVNMGLQPQFGMLVPNHLSAHGAAPFHHPQVMMGSNNGSMLQNHYRGVSSNYYRRANMEPIMGQNLMEGSSNGRGKRKFNWGNGAEFDEVNSFPSQQLPNTTHQDQQPIINLFGPMNGFRSDAPSVYDQIYEGLGLPIDPHLRLFLASMDSSNPWGPKQ